jgi:cellulose synthase/poly-beta-1,6-N-acetylglucosamine synthase-like glycosyltransferase
MIRRWLLWGSVAILGLIHLVLPVVILIRGRLRPAPYTVSDITPPVSVVLAAHDEASSIEDRLRDLLALDYPVDRLEIVVASDGSTDGTVELARSVDDARIHVLDLPRVGKAAALQAAIDASTNEIVAFTDANSMWEPTALRALVAPFADPQVGGVAGDQRYLDEAGTRRRDRTTIATGQDATAGGWADGGERRYWDFDRELKRAESRAGDVISATGAIYAVRRELVGVIRPDVTDDFYISTGVIAAGRRLVFAPDAIAWEPVAATAAGEFDRKVRILTRGLRAVVARRALLDVRRHGFYSIQLATHKLLRRLAVYPLLVAGIASASLVTAGRGYALLAAAQAFAWTLGLVGLRMGERPVARNPLFALPAFAALVSLASLIASLRVLAGDAVTHWEPRR